MLRIFPLQRIVSIPSAELPVSSHHSNCAAILSDDRRLCAINLWMPKANETAYAILVCGARRSP
jgi:hypothetical protein